MKAKLYLLLIIVLIIAACSALPSSAPSGGATESEPTMSFTLISTAFANGASIADKYTYHLRGQCNGENFSPPLSWTAAPSGTQSFVIIMIDPDGGNWTHWIQFNIPDYETELKEAVDGPAIGIKGSNDFGGLGYGGPCPPGGTHRYVITIYALDTTLSLSEGAKHRDVESAMTGHILGEAQLMGLRSKK